MPPSSTSPAPFPAVGFISTHSTRLIAQAPRRHLNWTEQSSSFPSSFEGCQAFCPKNRSPPAFEAPCASSFGCNAPSSDSLHLSEDSRVLERGKLQYLLSFPFGLSFVHALGPLRARFRHRFSGLECPTRNTDLHDDGQTVFSSCTTMARYSAIFSTAACGR